MESHDSVPKDLPRISRRAIIILAVVVVAAFVGFFFLGNIPRHRRIAEQKQAAQDVAAQLPVVQVMPPKLSDSKVSLTLPGDARPLMSTAIYARATGYLEYHRPNTKGGFDEVPQFDINDFVKKGDLLAEIDAPDVDADLNQARANLEQAKANVNQQQTNYDLNEATYNRYKGLIPTGGVTQQQLDERQSAANQAQAALIAAHAAVKSSEAAVQRLEALQGFEKIYAPFAGIITARNYDKGALISPTDTAPGHELFDIANVDVLRIYVNVPQTYATMVKTQTPVSFVVRNYPGREFAGKVTRTTGELDPATRTLRTELDFDNKDHLLFAGMYGEIKFTITRQDPLWIIPTSALLFEASGTQVAIVKDDDTVHFQKITVGRDFGTELEVMTGLTGHERIISNPGAKLAEGIKVKIVGDTKGAPASPPPGSKSATTQNSGPGVRVAENGQASEGK